MRKLLAAALLFGLGACSMGADLPIADQAVTRFHKMLDAGQNAQIYRESAQEMKNAGPEAKLDAFLSAVHRKLGTVTKATRQGFNDQMNTGGHYITMTYATTYTRGEATETFVYKISDGKAALVGYNVNSDALIIN